jgi:hypothetical protein
MYQITDYTKEKAKMLGVKVMPSRTRSKKIDVYKNGDKVASVGGSGYSDYGTYLKEKGFEYAEKRRKLYKIRHNKDRSVVNSSGWWADQLLW